MSELINNNKDKLQHLIDYAIGMLDGEGGAALYRKYKSVLEEVTPGDVITIVDELVRTKEEMDDIKRSTNKILNIFYKTIKSFGRFEPEPGTFIYYLMKENREMEKKMENFRINIKKIFASKDPKAELKLRREEVKSELIELLEYEKHWVKKENILFPYIEKYFDNYRCVSVMWSMHDDSRESIKTLLENLEQDEPLINVFNMNIGKLYYSVLPVIFREEYILYPIAAKEIKQSDWDEMLAQSEEEGFAFIEPPESFTKEVKQKEGENIKPIDNLVDLGTGILSADEIIRIFNHLPVDITFVDENDEVKYFSTPKDRIFGRSKAIIGRKVQNCHPHESVHIVNEIVDSFKSGKKDVESFWISFKDKFLLIQYFAVRDEQGSYKGVIEVSQDVSDIRKLEGEKRLLDM